MGASDKESDDKQMLTVSKASHAGLAGLKTQQEVETQVLCHMIGVTAESQKSRISNWV